MGKQVPLVIYKGGERIVIGMASIQDDGKIEGQIARDVREDVKNIIAAGVGDVSINPKPPIPLPYHEPVVKTIKTTKVQE